MGMEDWAYRWGVEDVEFGLPCDHRGSPATPEIRERYMKGRSNADAYIAANRALVEREKARARASQAQWLGKGEAPKHAKRKGKHEHGADW